ncbi:MAG: hypothetical protein GC158_15030 [Cyanobacteria bacterium RI_101]|nr:hypothetical protein [Cyanobacteria bacterium RI_101]
MTSVFDNQGQALSFGGTPTRITDTGPNLNSRVLFTNVRTIDGQQIDAIVTVTNLRNATITGFDTVDGSTNAAPLISNTTENVLSLNTDIGAGGGDVTIKVDFILGGSYNATTNPNGTTVILQNVIVNSYDIDGVAGSSSTNNLQYQEFSGAAQYSIVSAGNGGKLTATQSGGTTRFQTSQGGNTTAGPGTNGGDIIRVQAKYDSLSSFTLVTGGGTSGGAGGVAYYYLDFSSGPAFSIIPTTFYTVSGSVLRDVNNNSQINNPGDLPQSGVTVNLLTNAGTFIRSTTTDANGDYFFSGLADGTYKIQKVNPSGVSAITDVDGGDANEIIVTVSGGNVVDRDFLVGLTNPASISGTVLEDTNGNDTINNPGDTPIAGVTVELLSGTTVIATTTTNGSGNYSFSNLSAGNYTVRQTNKDSSYLDVTDKDGQGTANTIAVTLTAGQNSAGNDFLDERTRPIVDLNSAPTTTTNTSNQTVNLVQGGNFGTTNGETPPASWTEGGSSVASVSGTSNRWIWTDTPGGTLTQIISFPTSTSNTTAASPTSEQTVATSSSNLTSISFGLAWQNADTSRDNQLQVRYNSVLYATLQTGTNAPTGSWTYTNGASGSAPSTSVADESTGTLTTITITLPSGIATGGNLVFTYADGPSSGTGSDDIAIDNVVINTTTTTTTTTKTVDGDYNWATTYNANGGPAVSIADTDSSVFEPLSPNMQSATIVLTNPKAGDKLLVNGVDANSGSLTLGGATVNWTRTNGTQINFTGNATPAQYADFIEAVQFSSPGTIDATQRIVDVTVVDVFGTSSNTAKAFINIQAAGAISGKVYADTGSNGDFNDGNFDAGELGLAGVKIELFQGGTLKDTVFTDSNGNYLFTGLTPGGNYRIVQTQPANYDSGLENNSNEITNVTVTAGQTLTTGTNFGEVVSSISGFVKLDANDNLGSTGDQTALGNIQIQLLNASGSVVATTTTNGTTGFYQFADLKAGTYTVRQIDPGTPPNSPTYPDASDTPTFTGGGGTYTKNVNGTLNDEIAGITLGVATNLTNYDFFETQFATITGAVYEDADNDGAFDIPGDTLINGVTVELVNSSGVTVATTTTVNGAYSFTNVNPGSYTVRQTNLTGYADVTDKDGTTNGTTINEIAVTVRGGDINSGNNFLDNLPNISGRVLEDLDNDNVLERDTDTRLGNVFIELLDSNFSVIATTSTDGEGNYSFDNYLPGTYYVRQTNSSNLLNDVTDKDGGSPGNTSNTPTANPNLIAVNLVQGQNNTANDFLDNLVTGVIGGRVFEDADDATLPGFSAGDVALSGVTVRLYQANDLNNPIATDTTDADGLYFFDALLGGTYVVIQEDLPGYNSVRDNEGDTTTPASNTFTRTIDAQNTSFAGLNFLDNLPNITGFVYEDADDLTASGFSAGDTPISGVTVKLFDNSGSTVPIRTTVTGSDGKYVFANLLPGDYRVEQENLPGYASVTDKDGATTNTVDQIAVTLVKGVDNEGNNFLDNLPNLSGFVYEDADNDGTFAGTNTPISGAIIELRNSSGVTVATAPTDSNGQYVFTNVLPGNYTIFENSLAGYTDVTDIDGNGNGNSLIAVTESQLLNGNVTGQNFLNDLNRGSISGDVLKDANNSGTVNGGDTDIEGVLIELFLGTNTTGAPFRTATTDDGGNYSFTGLDAGIYTIKQTDLSGYWSVADDDGANDNIIAVNLAQGQNSTSNTFLDNVTLISGNVSADTNNDDNGDVNLNNVLVELFEGTTIQSGQTPFRTVRTGPDGNYSFDAVPFGDYVIRQTNLANYGDVKDIDAVNDNLISVTLSALAPRSTGNNFVDEELGEIRGFVYIDADNDGIKDPGETTGISEVTVTLTDVNNPAFSETRQTGADGSYSFAGLRPGTYTVTQPTQPSGYPDGQDTQGNTAPISGSNTTDVITPITLTAGQTSANNNFGELGGSISGSVLYDTNNDGTIGASPEGGISGVTINLYKGGVFVTSTTTLANGSYTFTGLAPGNDYKVEELEPSGFVDATTQPNVPGTRTTTTGADEISAITVASGNTTSGLDFYETKTGSLSGRVLDDRFGQTLGNIDLIPNTLNDKGIFNAQVILTNAGADGLFGTADDTVQTTTTLADGTYRFDNLLPSLYNVRQIDLPNYTSVRDIDNGDPNYIGNVRVNAEQEVTERNFLDISKAGSIAGFVFDDKPGITANTFDQGDQGISGVTVTLIWAGIDGDFGTAEEIDGNSGAAKDNKTTTTTTAADGSYLFSNLGPGLYRIQETDLNEYFSLADVDRTNGSTNTDNLIGNINLSLGQNLTGQNFLDSSPVVAGAPALPSVQLLKTITSTSNASNGNDPDLTVEVWGETINYQITLQNLSSVPIPGTDLTVTDPMLGTLTRTNESVNPNGNLDANETWTFTGSATLNQGTLGQYTNALSSIESQLPSRVQMVVNPASANIYSFAPGGVRDSYFDGFISNPTLAGQNILNGWKNVWCVDVDRTAWVNGLFNAKVFSTYNIPTNEVNVDIPGNLDLVNWVLNQNYVGKETATGSGVYFTAGDVQSAIWKLIDDNKTATLDLGDFTVAKANQIVAAANAFQAANPTYQAALASNGNNATAAANSTTVFTPGFGDTLAVLVIPLSTRGVFAGRQKLIVEVELPTSGTLTNTAEVTYTYNGETFSQASSVTTTVSGLTSTRPNPTAQFNPATISGGIYVDTLIAGNAQDTITGGASNDRFQFQFGSSSFTNNEWKPDRITDFAIGGDKIDLLTTAGVDAGLPASFTRAADDTTSATLSDLVNNVFADANGLTAGSQALGANSAALVTATNSGIAGTYLVINNGNAGQDSTDLLINITGDSSLLPALGSITPSAFFS